MCVWGLQILLQHCPYAYKPTLWVPHLPSAPLLNKLISSLPKKLTVSITETVSQPAPPSHLVLSLPAGQAVTWRQMAQIRCVCQPSSSSETYMAETCLWGYYRFHIPQWLFNQSNVIFHLLISSGFLCILGFFCSRHLIDHIYPHLNLFLIISFSLRYRVGNGKFLHYCSLLICISDPSNGFLFLFFPFPLLSSLCSHVCQC